PRRPCPPPEEAVGWAMPRPTTVRTPAPPTAPSPVVAGPRHPGARGGPAAAGGPGARPSDHAPRWTTRGGRRADLAGAGAGGVAVAVAAAVAVIVATSGALPPPPLDPAGWTPWARHLGPTLAGL